MSLQNSDAENLVLIEMLDTNEDGEVDSFEWTTMLSKVGICKKLTNRFHVAEHLFSNRSQMTSSCGKI